MAEIIDPLLKECFDKKKIKSFAAAPKMALAEAQASAADLKAASQSFIGKQYKWTIVQCYYAMFHAGRALLYLTGHRERSHYCLILALRHFYVSRHLMPSSLLENLHQAKTLRENADYYGQFNRDSAVKSLQDAKEFVAFVRKYIKTSGKK